MKNTWQPFDQLLAKAAETTVDRVFGEYEQNVINHMLFNRHWEGLGTPELTTAKSHVLHYGILILEDADDLAPVLHVGPISEESIKAWADRFRITLGETTDYGQLGKATQILHYPKSIRYKPFGCNGRVNKVAFKMGRKFGFCVHAISEDADPPTYGIIPSFRAFRKTHWASQEIDRLSDTVPTSEPYAYVYFPSDEIVSRRVERVKQDILSQNEKTQSYIYALSTIEDD